MQGVGEVKRGGKRAIRGALALTAGLLALGVATAGAAPGADSTPEGQRALDQATAAVTSPDAALPSGEDATLALRDLALAYPRLRGADRRRARALLQRPPIAEQGAAEIQLGSGWNVPESVNSPACTKHFCVHFVDISEDAPPPADNDGRSDGDGVPDYVEKVQKTVEQTYKNENGKLGWRKPKPDGNRGGNSKVDVYLSQIGNVGLFGYANTDPGQSGNRRFSYLVLDNDYKEFAPLTPLKALQVTVAHEYNHILQFGIDYYEQLWMYEASATWMEEQVYPAVSDWLRYVPAFATAADEPLTRPSAGGGLKIYGDAAFMHFLSKGAGLGASVVRDAWEKSPKVKPKHFAPAALGASIKKHRGPSFGKAFSKFAAATAEWNAGHDFPDAKRLKQVKRAGKLKLGHAKRTKLDHLAFQLYNVKVGSANKIRLRLRAKKGTQSAVALIARRGSRSNGKAKRHVVYMPRGGTSSVSFGGLQRYRRVTALVSNSDGRRSQGRYRGDNSRYKLKLAPVDRRAKACRCRQ